MTQAPVTDEMLMALADGELAPSEAAAVRARLQSDPVLAARFAAYAETRALLQPPPAATPGAASPADERLAAAIRARAKVDAGDDARVALLRPQRKGPFRRGVGHLPLAASVLLALGGVAGYFVGAQMAREPIASGAGLSLPPGLQSAVNGALQRVASGADTAWSDAASGRAGRIILIATHRLGDSTLCREFEIAYEQPTAAAIVGASCRRGGAWRLEIAATKPDRGSGYAPASGIDAVDRYLNGLGSTGPLAAGDEAALLARGW